MVSSSSAPDLPDCSDPAAMGSLLRLGDCGSRPNSRCCLLTGEAARQLAPDLLAGGCLQAPDGPVALWALACAAAGPIIALRSERTWQPGPPPLRRTELDIVAAPIGLVAAEAQPIDPGVTLGARIAPAGAIAMRAPYVRRSVACGLAIARQRRRRAVVDRLADAQLSTGGPLTCRANEGSPRSQNGCPNHRNSGSSAAR